MPKKMANVKVTLPANVYKTLLKIAELRQVSPASVATELLAGKLGGQKKLLKAFRLPVKDHKTVEKQ